MTFDPKTLLYAPTHEWAHVAAGPGGEKIVTVGISDFALHALTDLVHIDLPQPGRQVKAGGPFGEVESVKAVSDLYSPVDGEVVEVNSAVPDNLEMLGKDPYGEGWLIKVKLSDESALAKLMDFPAYQKKCREAAHDE
jgi:glycine cleavage system H protein